MKLKFRKIANYYCANIPGYTFHLHPIHDDKFTLWIYRGKPSTGPNVDRIIVMITYEEVIREIKQWWYFTHINELTKNLSLN